MLKTIGRARLHCDTEFKIFFFKSFRWMILPCIGISPGATRPSAAQRYSIFFSAVMVNVLSFNSICWIRPKL